MVCVSQSELAQQGLDLTELHVVIKCLQPGGDQKRVPVSAGVRHCPITSVDVVIAEELKDGRSRRGKDKIGKARAVRPNHDARLAE